eukprot:CAMPEP_0197834880 /NCGR_PEP_ID=MMETSP1437-20131217/24036_1 /TAXON_ID=49252 ORGANISM="Eucampia antarctica, Strain CCMP1452" /NCGR_SAMPLE_ID=MMETSP1437 /ASSEMBLY_ACC=CAM_ASM_001096 /LENGTH=291 /DNA_ID=CAMNT_0043439915 /DNA_START=189 /DNA_END=1064 /DNA_ORIENTATION=+
MGRGSSKCPVQQSRNPNSLTTTTQSADNNYNGWFAFSSWWKDNNNNNLNSNKQEVKKESCSLEEAAKHSQKPLSDQEIPLSTRRVISSIPKGKNDNDGPHHQPSDGNSDNRWVYPSEQQFYNAMRRKGWTGVDEATIPFVVRIHNEVNERGWKEVCRWERELHDNDSPKLVKFLGRPEDLSPKAFLYCRLLRFYKDPFDRHDWYIQSSDSTPPRRYVIDFYNGNGGGISTPAQQSQQPSMHIDVRPAIDHPEALWDRMRMTARETFPGIFTALSSPSSSSQTSTPAYPNKE